jgi:hypothetical protein
VSCFSLRSPLNFLELEELNATVQEVQADIILVKRANLQISVGLVSQRTNPAVNVDFVLDAGQFAEVDVGISQFGLNAVQVANAPKESVSDNINFLHVVSSLFAHIGLLAIDWIAVLVDDPAHHAITPSDDFSDD